MLRERILTIITVVFCFVCSVWFVCLIMDSRKRSSMFDDSASLRNERALANKSGNIKIGVVLNNDADTSESMKSAYLLAQEKLNASGLLGGRKVELVFRNDDGNVNRALRIAQDFADDLDISVVLGHVDSGTTINVLPIYEFYGILLFSPVATSPCLSRSGAKFFVRNAPNDVDLAAAMSEFCDMKGLKRIVILFPDSAYGRGMANAVESQASRFGVDVIDRKVFLTTDPQFGKILDDWKLLYKFNAVIAVFNEVKNCRSYMELAANKGQLLPVLLAPDMSKIIPYAQSRTTWPPVYLFDTSPQNPHASGADTVWFYQEFLQKTGKKPSYIDYNAFDALLAVGWAIEKSGVPAASKIAQALKNSGAYEGTSGPVTFSKNGDPLRQFSVSEISRGQLTFYHKEKNEKE